MLSPANQSVRAQLRKKQTNKSDRSCGDCTMCCVWLKIESKPGFSTRLDTGEDLAKEAGDPCKYLVSQKCTIYENRPAVCRRFFCDWALGKKGFSLEDSPLVTKVIGICGTNVFPL